MRDVLAEPGCADVCLILEGTYPYVAGGVSSWVHDLVQLQAHLSFHIIVLVAPDSKRDLRYSLPDNVIGMTVVTLQKLPRGVKKPTHAKQIIQGIESVLSQLTSHGGFSDLLHLLRIITPLREQLGSHFLLESRDAWDMLLHMYQRDFNDSSFLDYFWSWRGLLGGMYSVILGELPPARVYHAASTGYAGLYLARAKIETGRPTMVTEHGIYTNERCIEIAMADWLHEEDSLLGLNVHRVRRDLKDLWMHSFQSYSRACYQSCDQVITLFEGNQSFQLHNGANAEQMSVIPNGIDYDYFSKIQRVDTNDALSVALIGRVVPIKDVKTYIRAIAQVREVLPKVHGYLLGPFDEDPDYYDECQLLVEHLGLEDGFTFTGSVDLVEWLGRIDLIVLTSISEGQPLVILEAGAAGVPCIATDVGACREMIEGDSRECPPLGKGGEVVPLCSQSITAKAMIRLLSDPDLLRDSGETMRQRVRLYYNKNDLRETYKSLYNTYCYYPNKDDLEEELA